MCLFMLLLKNKATKDSLIKLSLPLESLPLCSMVRKCVLLEEKLQISSEVCRELIGGWISLRL